MNEDTIFVDAESDHQLPENAESTARPIRR
mgnify:CR=1 FL=1